jgi:uncharacterized protein (DUF952 family)/ribosomal protein S18 acetylase RimI-like enzyme
MTSIIRPYEASDRDAVYDVCVRVVDDGRDARGKYATDDLMPDIFAGPYLALEPNLAFVLDAADRADGGGTEGDRNRAVGYVLGTADTAEFVGRYRGEWLPTVAGKYDRTSIPLLFDPERMLVTELADYPAHLHIGLLPEYQGRGYGRTLIRAFCAAVAERAKAVHLAMSTSNVKARAFYDRLGFHVIDVPGAPERTTYLGRPTGDGPIYKLLRHGEAETGAEVDRRDGFIHLSTREQLARTAELHFAGETDLLLLHVDPVKLGAGLRWEPSRGGDLFPHYYGELPGSAVVREVPVPDSSAISSGNASLA